MKPPEQVDNKNILHLIHGDMEKIHFLGKINEAEDNSSELAGFEINKLLGEQAKLENNYASLIKQRSILKGIENKKEYRKIQEQIADVGRGLRESTKKLCRLFKENTNLDDDSLKVRGEREELLNHLDQFMVNIESNTFPAMIDVICTELDSQNKLGEYLEKEKDLNEDIQELKKALQRDTQDYQNEMNEKQTTIQKLKEDLSKAKAESAIKLRYDKKEIKTNQDTQKRLAKQKQEDIMNQTKEVERLRQREIEVFEKISGFLGCEEDRIKKDADDWTSHLDNKRDQKEKGIDTIKEDTKKAKDRQKKLRDEYDKEVKLQDDEENRIKNILNDKKNKGEKEKKIDEAMMLIQKEFEIWLGIMGPSKKKRGGMKK